VAVAVAVAVAVLSKVLHFSGVVDLMVQMVQPMW
jgi:hypothetical protein